jgi:hypothetical protein
MGQAKWAPAETTRVRAYAAVAAAFFLFAVGLAGVKACLLGQPFDLVVSDGRFYYAYLPSVVIDGDLDFSNQISEHWGSDFDAHLLDDRTPSGLVRNKYPIGFALTLAPAFLLGHLVALLSWGHIAADGYTWPYQIACLALIELLVWRILVLTDRLLTHRLGIAPRPALLGLLVMALGTPFAYYACREPFMVHAVSALWCTQLVTVAAGAPRGPAWFWPRLAFCGAMAIVCRPTNAHLAPVAVAGVLMLVRTAGLGRTVLCLPLTMTALVPIGLQFLAWRLLSGHWVYYSYGGEAFDWTHPALVETLLSSRHGLFFWSPMLLLAMVGLVHVRDTLIRSWMLGGMLLWYANSSWHCWWFGDAFGGRSFLELSGLFGIGLAAWFARQDNRPWLSAMLAVAAIAFNVVLMALYITHAIPRDGYLLSWGVVR